MLSFCAGAFYTGRPLGFEQTAPGFTLRPVRERMTSDLLSASHLKSDSQARAELEPEASYSTATQTSRYTSTAQCFIFSSSEVLQYANVKHSGVFRFINISSTNLIRALITITKRGQTKCEKTRRSQ